MRTRGWLGEKTFIAVSLAAGFLAASARGDDGPEQERPCRYYEENIPPVKIEADKTDADKTALSERLANCAVELSSEVQAAWACASLQEDARKTDARCTDLQSTDALDAKARWLYRGYKTLKEWDGLLRKATKKTKEGPSESQRQLKRALEDLKEGGVPRTDQDGNQKGATDKYEMSKGVHDLMAILGLRNEVSALFVTGYVNSAVAAPDPAASSSEGTPAASTTAPVSETPLVGYIAWSSRHYGLQETDRPCRECFRIDASVSGRVGLQPALTLVKAESSASGSGEGAASPPPTSAADGAERAVFQDAFMYDIGARLHIHMGSHWEIDGAFRAGQTSLLEDVTLLTSGDQAQIVVPIGGPGTGGWRWFYEAGGTIRYNVQSLEILHEQNGLVEPAFELAFGVRKDNRLETVETGQVVFADNWERKVFRFMVNGVPVRNAPGQKDKTKLFTLSMGVDYEWGGTVPATTRLTFKGNVDLIKALRGR